MKTENLTKASHSLDFLMEELRQAHCDAVNSGGQFEPALFDLMEEALKLQATLSGIREAVNQVHMVKKKG